MLSFWDSIPSPVEVPILNDIRPTRFKTTEVTINDHQEDVPAVIYPPASKMPSHKKHNPSPNDWIGLEEILPFEDYGLQDSVSTCASGHPLTELDIAIPNHLIGKYAPVMRSHGNFSLPPTLPATKGATDVPSFTIPPCMFDHLRESNLFLNAIDDRISKCAKSEGTLQTFSRIRTLLQAVAAVSSWKERDNGIYAYFAAFCMAVVLLMRQNSLRFFTHHVFHVMCGMSYAQIVPLHVAELILSQPHLAAYTGDRGLLNGQARFSQQLLEKARRRCMLVNLIRLRTGKNWTARLNGEGLDNKNGIRQWMNLFNPDLQKRTRFQDFPQSTFGLVYLPTGRA
jgi:hypothetical protein